MEQFSLSYKSYSIACYKWEVNNPKLNILIVHGLGEHAMRYSELAEYFNSNEISVFAFDHIGHGRTTGQRGAINDYQDLLNQLDLLGQYITDINKNIPLVVYGHSFGGNVSANYFIRDTHFAQALILSAPWFMLPFKPNPLLVAFGKLMKNIYPSFDNSNSLEVEAISRVPEEVQKYKSDSLIHDRITPSLFFPTEEAGLYAISNASKISVPTLVMHGSADRLTSCIGSEKFCANNKEFIFKKWDGFYHELHKDIGKEEVFEYVINWLKKNGFLSK